MPAVADPNPRAIDQDIAAHYAESREQDRLTAEVVPLERIRTQEILLRYLPLRPAVVLDVGGGPGVYAFWLAERGYTVHLIDPVPLHLEQARARAGISASALLAAISLGDARRLEFETESADAVLLLGPLYHLTSRADRLLALREGNRVLRA